jgi:glycosyltransferase involved in cell wall biosynthesis
MRQNKISVVIPSYNSEKTIVPCLESIVNQDFRIPFEIIVVDSSVDSTPHIIRKEFPQVTLIHLDQKTDPGTARNIGVKKAKGDIIAFIDSDCVASPEWLSGVSSAHRSEYAAVGGPVINGNPQSIISWAGYLIEFNEWLPGNPKGFVKHIPTCNISYKRRVFELFGGFLTLYPQEDFLYNLKLTEAGERILLEPKIEVTHNHRVRLRHFLNHQIRRGKSGFGIRKTIPIQGAFLVNYPYLALLLLPKRVITITARFLKRRPASVLTFLYSLPFVVLGIACWIAGFLKEAYTRKI